MKRHGVFWLRASRSFVAERRGHGRCQRHRRHHRGVDRCRGVRARSPATAGSKIGGGIGGGEGLGDAVEVGVRVEVRAAKSVCEANGLAEPPASRPQRRRSATRCGFAEQDRPARAIRGSWPNLMPDRQPGASARVSTRGPAPLPRLAADASAGLPVGLSIGEETQTSRKRMITVGYEPI
jgi:hypothetical protein